MSAQWEWRFLSWFFSVWLHFRDILNFLRNLCGWSGNSYYVEIT